jgi:hypothetical protein
MTYPYTEAGWKGTETSREAALIVSHNLKALHTTVLNAFIKHGNMTPEEASEITSMTLHNCRSRCSELKGMNLLEATGEKRVGTSGLNAGVLRIVR